MTSHPLYSRQVLDHFLAPRQAGPLLIEDDSVVSGRAGSEHTGSVVFFQFRLNDQQQIVDSRFRAYGCGATIAVGSYVASTLLGQTLAQARALKGVAIAQALALEPVKLHCALLAEDAITSALQHITDFNQE